MLPEWYQLYKEKIDLYIQKYFQKYVSLYKNPTSAITDFIEVVQYSISGGKRFRGILAIEFYLSITGKKIQDLNIEDDIIKFAIAMEYMHSFSLIHDDLPCMDNDEYRRGQLTVWKKHGEASAMLAGDTLNTLAFELLSEISTPTISQKLTKLLSRSTGIFGMIGGQVEDMYYENKVAETSQEILTQLHNKKTGQIITCSILGGIILADREDILEKFEIFGKNLGLAFQIKDDLLDIEGTFEETGKSVGGEKKGFVYILGIEKSKNQLDTLILNCLNDIAPLKSEKLNFMVQYVKDRKK